MESMPGVLKSLKIRAQLAIFKAKLLRLLYCILADGGGGVGVQGENCDDSKNRVMV